MKLFGGRLDISGLDPLPLFDESAVEKAALNIFEEAVVRFAEMASERLVSGYIDSLPLGSSESERMQLIRENVHQYIARMPRDERELIHCYVRAKLRDYAISTLAAEHHWN